eukprot:4648176-Pyramimonas_sp.AAC.1
MGRWSVIYLNFPTVRSRASANAVSSARGTAWAFPGTAVENPAHGSQPNGRPSSATIAAPTLRRR